MARKKTSTRAPRQEQNTAPRFPYTTKPSSLRRLLKDIPNRPRPPKFDKPLLKSWGFGDSNDMTMLRVLKSVNLLNDRNEPTDIYSAFMNLSDGSRALGPEIKKVYAPFFQASHAPFNETNEKLKNLFNIHSGGGDRAIENQIQTFKALCENAIFDGEIAQNNSSSNSESPQGAATNSTILGQTPAVHINLHIHLPENKTRRDYEDIIEDIGKYIFGREIRSGS